MGKARADVIKIEKRENPRAKTSEKKPVLRAKLGEENNSLKLLRKNGRRKRNGIKGVTMFAVRLVQGSGKKPIPNRWGAPKRGPGWRGLPGGFFSSKSDKKGERSPEIRTAAVAHREVQKRQEARLTISLKKIEEINQDNVLA